MRRFSTRDAQTPVRVRFPARFDAWTRRRTQDALAGIVPSRTRPRRATIRIATCLVLLAAGLPSGAQEHTTDAGPQAGSPRQDDADPVAPRVLFDGRTLEGLRVLDTGFYKRHGEVEVVDGVIRLHRGPAGTGVGWEGDAPKMNYEVALEARRIDGGDFFCGLTFPVEEGHCTLIVGGWGGGLTGLSNIDGFAADENGTTGFTEFENERWYKIRLRVDEKSIQAWIDDRSILKQETAGHRYDVWWEQEPARPLGMTTYQTGAELRNITLRRVMPEGEK